MSSDFYSTLCRRSGRENVDVFVPDLHVALRHVKIDGVVGLEGIVELLKYMTGAHSAWNMSC